VSINGNIRGSIGKGLVLLLGIEEADSVEDMEWLVPKIVQMRIFNDENGVMNCSCLEQDAEILLISQFTLFASTRKGNRPSYSRAAKGPVALPLYENFKMQLEACLGKPVATGEFGADMQVSLQNDGPVTIMIDSKNRE
jgi:D-tyrosyl-tRNA(Tyr) deacylase